MAFFTDVFNAARNVFRPRSSAQSFQARTPFGLQPTQQQQRSILTYPSLSSPSAPIFQGPVPEGFDEGHFRATGETKPLPGNAPLPRSAPAPAPSSGGGGGGGNNQPSAPSLSEEALAALDRAASEGRFEGISDPEERARAQQALEQERLAEVGDLFSETERLLDDSARNIGSEEDLIAQASRPFESQVPLLTQARDEGLAGVDRGIEAERLQEQNAINDARRLAQELRTANQQRFGGASSAGEFANSIQSREFQRQFGRIQNTAGQNVNALRQKASEIKNQYNQQLQSLELQKEGAIAQARDLYRQRLSAIDNARISLSQNKAAARLDALRDLRNHARSIQDQFRTLQLQLFSQAQQADLSLRNAVLAFREQNDQPIDLANVPEINISTAGGIKNSSAGANLPLGSLTRRLEEEEVLG